METVLGKKDDPNLPDNTMDMVVLVNVIHLVEDQVSFLRNTKSDFKPGGRLVLVQWDAEKLAREAPDPDKEPKVTEFLREPLLQRIAEAGS